MGIPRLDCQCKNAMLPLPPHFGAGDHGCLLMLGQEVMPPGLSGHCGLVRHCTMQGMVHNARRWTRVETFAYTYGGTDPDAALWRG